jgi:LDH2 family malate/lactate/ureidoglycolate dehydrogenase
VGILGSGRGGRLDFAARRIIVLFHLQVFVSMRKTDSVHLSAAEAATLGERALNALGYDDEQARVITDHLVDAMLCGLDYAGLPRILTINEDPRSKLERSPLAVVHETPVSAMHDGGNNVGYYTVSKAAELAAEKARLHGISVVGLYRSHLSGHSTCSERTPSRSGFLGREIRSSWTWAPRP